MRYEYNSDMKSARTRVVPYEWKLKEGEWTRAMEGQGKEKEKEKKKRPARGGPAEKVTCRHWESGGVFCRRARTRVVNYYGGR